VTDGILSRKIVSTPLLAGIAVVILDEFHERHIATDLALSYLRQLQRAYRPDLKLAVMSATLEVDPLAHFMGDAAVLESGGAPHRVQIEYERTAGERPLEEKIVAAVRRLLSEGLDGDLLVFLPGAAEIRKAAQVLAPTAKDANLLVLPLHGDLSPREQACAVEPAGRMKIILATNVAETSVTIPSIAAVVDSGLARVANHSAWSGLPVIRIAKISKASAAQRAGRAGRTRSGRVLRLYTRTDFEARPEHDIPEIRRSDLAETLLTLHGAGVTDIRSFPWFEPPPQAAVDSAEELLIRLGALDSSGCLTEMGRRMLPYPVHPRLARLIDEGERLGAGKDATLVAALLAERDIRLESRTRFDRQRRHTPARSLAASDPTELRDSYREAERLGFEPRLLRTDEIDPGAVDRVRRAHGQLSRLLGRVQPRPNPAADPDEAVRIAILASFPDRVAKRRAPGSRELIMAGGGPAKLAAESAVHEATFMVAVDAAERRDQKSPHGLGEVLVRLASSIEPEWLVALFPDAVQDSVDLKWNDAAGRVDESRRTMYGQVVLEESIKPAPSSEAVSRMLADHAQARVLSRSSRGDELPELLARLAILAEYFPEENLKLPEPNDIRAALEEACAGKRSLRELEGVSISGLLRSRLSRHQSVLLTRETPERIQVGPRRQLKVHYHAGRGPWIESRLQDFLGIRSTPRLCGGRLPLTIHLLAPSGRPVQVTQDLEGFWERHYPTLRRELRRRYPKHAWPDP
jgi:ATP-dependent helicase HrpB